MREGKREGRMHVQEERRKNIEKEGIIWEKEEG